jgi:DNA-binding transcriptional ArsR family regulator
MLHIIFDAMTGTILETDLQIEIVKIKKAAHVFRAINNQLRQQMLRLLHQNGRMTVTTIYVRLQLEQSVASQHLAILRNAGLVSTNRDGKFVFYSVNYQRLAELHSKAVSLIS